MYIGTDLIAAWGLNLEFGVTGVPNLAYIVFFAAGAYAYAVLTVGPSSQFGGAESYIIGARLPAVPALVIATAAAGVLGLLVGLTGLRGCGSTTRPWRCLSSPSSRPVWWAPMAACSTAWTG